MVKYQTCLIRRVGGESADDYEEWADAYIPTGASVLESTDSELESADSTGDASKVSVWVHAFTALLKVFIYWVVLLPDIIVFSPTDSATAY